MLRDIEQYYSTQIDVERVKANETGNASQYSGYDLEFRVLKVVYVVKLRVSSQDPVSAK